MPCIPQKSKWEAARTIQLAHKLETNEKPIKTDRTLPKKEFFGGKWREYGRRKRKYDRLWKSLQERARLNIILWYFPRGEIILGVLEIPCTSKTKVSSCQNHPTRPETGKKMTNLSKPNASQKKFFGVKWREYGRRKRKYDRLGKSLQERARLNAIPCDFPRGEIILGVLEMPCTSQNSKWAAARTIQLAHKLETIEQSIKTERFPKKSSLEGNEGNMEEEKGNMTGYENHYRKGPGWMPFRGISQEKKLF